jgi:hypothetical protein
MSGVKFCVSVASGSGAYFFLSVIHALRMLAGMACTHEVPGP